MRCKFCFATFQDEAGNQLPKGHLPRKEAQLLLEEIAAFGFEKINFAGGEPTLCPWLTALIGQAKDFGLTTSIVTNGTGLTDEFLRDNLGQLDWIGLSLDSVIDSTNLKSGRALRGKEVLTLADYCAITDRIRKFGFRLKINTVVGEHNKDEDLNEFILYAQPQRWKLFQALPVKGQNDRYINDFTIDQLAFQRYVDRHRNAYGLVVEDNDAMTNSYVMIDPSGKFFNNRTGEHQYSAPILDVGVEEAYREMGYSTEQFRMRGGEYSW